MGEEATQIGSLELKARTEVKSLCNGDFNNATEGGEGRESTEEMEEIERHRGTGENVSSIEVIVRCLY